MFVRVTGGMSRAVGGLCALDAGAEVWGTKPVRTIGGWRSVDMATDMLASSQCRGAYNTPFCPDSNTVSPQFPWSNAPPTECIEPAVEGLRELTEPCLLPVWKGKSGRCVCGEVGDERLSMDLRAPGFEYMVDLAEMGSGAWQPPSRTLGSQDKVNKQPSRLSIAEQARLSRNHRWAVGKHRAK